MQQQFVLPTYQRDYRWEIKHLQELLSDIQEAFLIQHKTSHGRKDILAYEQYFLGTIITTDVGKGGKAIVDGQQRITTLTLLLCYAHRLSLKHPTMRISPVVQTFRRMVAGQNEFNLDMSTPRRDLFNLLVDGPLDEEELAVAVDSIDDKDPGTEQIWVLFQEIENFIETEIKDGYLPHFFDFLTDCVCMFEIGVPREQDGHKVFVTMNDRGLKLSPIDLLKGFLLSGISSDDENHTAHAKWTECIQKLTALGSDEDSNFFKTWIRAKYATTIRGKKRGDVPGDFEFVGDSYHRWVMDNKESIGLRTSDDYSNLLKGKLPYFIDIYCKIKRCEHGLTDSFPHVYYNGARDMTLQAMVIISAINETDSSTDSTKKIKAISYFLDYLAVVRLLNGKENTYDNIRDLAFDLAKEVRGLSLQDIRTKLVARLDSEKDKLSTLAKVSYAEIKRQDLLHILARIACYLEMLCEQTNNVGFATYIDRTLRARTFDIEHIIPNNYQNTNSDIQKTNGVIFTSQSEFDVARNGIGGLLLLPRGRNRSMKDMVYSDKLQRYSTENILAQTLTSSFYMNQPNWSRFCEQTGITCGGEQCADIEALNRRAGFYLELARKICSKENFELLF
jgi:hypothetical protein